VLVRISASDEAAICLNVAGAFCSIALKSVLEEFQ
jgi:hypothetical protein